MTKIQFKHMSHFRLQNTFANIFQETFIMYLEIFCINYFGLFFLLQGKKPLEYFFTTTLCSKGQIKKLTLSTTQTVEKGKSAKENSQIIPRFSSKEFIYCSGFTYFLTKRGSLVPFFEIELEVHCPDSRNHKTIKTYTSDTRDHKSIKTYTWL